MNKVLITSLEDLDEFLKEHIRMRKIILVKPPKKFPAILIWKENESSSSYIIDGEYIYKEDFKKKVKWKIHQ